MDIRIIEPGGIGKLPGLKFIKLGHTLRWSLKQSKIGL
ncbi:MAG: hypothetical protein JWQ85_2082 [Mucilaginibacter sp.]|nr:hypothetical protein [Mucilaginibacter sp.]